MPSELQRSSDEELARETRAGCLAAFEELVRRYERRVYAFITHCCRNRADAQELTQDTFVRAFQAIAQFDPRRGYATWLFTIARRKCIDHHRAAPPAPAEEPMPELPDLADPAELLAQREDRQNLWQIARRRLPEAQFQALWLRYAEDMSVAGIARVLRKTQTHVKVLLFRAREVLRHELKATPIVGRTIPGVTADCDLASAGAASRHARRGSATLPGAPASLPAFVGKFSAAGKDAGAPGAGGVVECLVPGAVAGVGPGSGKKGLL